MFVYDHAKAPEVHGAELRSTHISAWGFPSLISIHGRGDRKKIENLCAQTYMYVRGMRYFQY